MGPKTEKLCRLLRETSQLLWTSNEVEWATWLDDGRKRLEAGDYSGVEFLKAGYGGMGSFNDFMITRFTPYHDNQSLNQRLDDLRRQIYDLLLQIRRDHEITG
jgi:hypothetical protein